MAPEASTDRWAIRDAPLPSKRGPEVPAGKLIRTYIIPSISSFRALRRLSLPSANKLS